jgi:hypothetical protein
MEAQTFENKDIQYAYRSIHDFFDYYGFSGCIKEAGQIIKAAASYKPWHRDAPYGPVYFMENLQQLIAAAYSIKNNYSSRAVCIINSGTGIPDLSLIQNYVSRYNSSTPWNNMPRHLTAAQYHDPYKAIEKFTKYATEPEWQQVCKDLVEYALSNASIDDEYHCNKLLAIRLHILRLIEACHLLELRSNPAKPQPQSKLQPKSQKKK